jgi:septal ring factor EnvC (AmiA/AmiB activator)
VTDWKRRSGFDARVVLVAAIFLLLVLAGAAALAIATYNQLEATRTTLKSTTNDLDDTTRELERAEAELGGVSADLGETNGFIAETNAEIRTLTFQIERKGECIEAQSVNLAEIRRILALERENFARTTSGSAWGRAHAASQQAINLAIDDLYKAYQQAAAGNYGTSNSWLDKSNDQIRASNTQLDTVDKEITAINAASDAIDAANDAFEKTLEETESTCGG